MELSDEYALDKQKCAAGPFTPPIAPSQIKMRNTYLPKSALP